MKKALFVFGTRPEAIKLASVINELKNDPYFEVRICVTAQHREMLDQILEIFEIRPDYDLDLMRPNQTLVSLTSKVLEGVNECLNNYKPDICIVQGDTTTVLASSLACFYNKIPVAHVEAGLRTHLKYNPFPEEMNRVITTHISSIHFSPTTLAKSNLLKEGIPEDSILVTGNTVIDALLFTQQKIKEGTLRIEDSNVNEFLLDEGKFILVTTHRRENFGDGIESICLAIRQIALEIPEIRFVIPVHLNPNVKEPVFRILGNLSNVVLLDPLNYVSFVALMSKCYFVLTDSGGVQEEAPSLGKPVLVMRENTERPEAVYAGVAILVGTAQQSIVENVLSLLKDEDRYKKIAEISNPFGDGIAAQRIAAHLKTIL